MTSSLVKELYNAPNGDHWALCKDVVGKLIVRHQPNLASGGQPSEIEVDQFLSRDGQGPEYQALREALTELHHGASAHENKGELSADAADKLSRALGQAVARCWSSLPQEIQHKLFEAAVISQGEVIRQELAVYLHGKHDRTIIGAQLSAVPEPDSQGG